MCNVIILHYVYHFRDFKRQMVFFFYIYTFRAYTFVLAAKLIKKKTTRILRDIKRESIIYNLLIKEHVKIQQKRFFTFFLYIYKIKYLKIYYAR